MYLGYNYKQELSIMCSRLTLLLQKEIYFTFFSEIEVDGDYLQGFSINKEITEEQALQVIKGLNTIYLNQDNKSERLFIICKDKEVLNKYYKMRWDGHIATIVCRKFDYFRNAHSESEVKKFRLKVEREQANKLIVIL